MEKLIELLNEYDDNNWGVTDYWALFNRMNEWISETEYLQVISKKFWFIKWLVDNDKIDFDKCWRCYEINSTYDHYNLENRQDLWLIMLLSISDRPIEDLISYLK